MARTLALAGLMSLIGCLFYWYGALLPSARLGAWLPALLTVPLLLPLPGLIRGKAYTHAWTSLLSLLYLTWALTELLANPPARPAAYPAFFSALMLFSGCLLFVRLDRRERETAEPG
ncbi:MAG: DUF2069 domain-containing protein, partial [Nevskiales bacterium]